MLVRVKNKLRRIRNRFRPKGAILMYHRIAEVEKDPWELCVSPQNFKEQLEVLSRLDHVQSLEHLSDNIIQRKCRQNKIALTFDDGYRDNFHNAKILLEEYKIPATFFISSGFTNSDNEFWWDELERLLLTPGQLPDKLELSGHDLSWVLNGASSLPVDEYNKSKGWTVGQAAPTRRHSLYYAIWSVLQDNPHDKQNKIIEHIAQWSGNGRKSRKSNLPLNKEELIELNKSEYVTIGAHTCYHPILPSLPINTQRTEICEGKKTLEGLIKQEITMFSYPYGKYNQDTLRLVEEAGFTYAYTTQPCLANGSQSRFALPRFQVKNWDGKQFEEKITNWLRG